MTTSARRFPEAQPWEKKCIDHLLCWTFKCRQLVLSVPMSCTSDNHTRQVDTKTPSQSCAPPNSLITLSAENITLVRGQYLITGSRITWKHLKPKSVRSITEHNKRTCTVKQSMPVLGGQPDRCCANTGCLSCDQATQSCHRSDDFNHRAHCHTHIQHFVRLG